MPDRTPVFDAGDLPAMLHTVEELAAATRTLGLVVIKLERALSVARQNLQRADMIARTPAPRVIDEAPKKEGICAGQRSIMRTLLLTYPEPMQKAVLFQKTNFKASTVRTYIPALRQAGYIQDDQFNIRLTVEGLEFISTFNKPA